MNKEDQELVNLINKLGFKDKWLPYLIWAALKAQVKKNLTNNK